MVPNTADPGNQWKPEINEERPAEMQRLDLANTGPDTADKSHSERANSDRVELKDLRAAFRNLEESKAGIIKRIQEIHRVSSDNADTRAKFELELENAQAQLAKSNKQLRALGEEVSSLRAELSTAKTLLEEIDQTLA